MFGKLTSTKCAVLCAIAAGALTAALTPIPFRTIDAQTPGQVGTSQGSPPLKPVMVLQERVDTDKYQKTMSLKDALKTLQEELAARKLELDIIVDIDVFKVEHPDAPGILETPVTLTALPRKVTAAMLLRQILNKAEPNNAAFVAFGDHVLITTIDRTSPESLLMQHVVAVYDKKPLAQVLRDLADKTGVSIALDRRAGDKEDYLISASFQRDATLAGALRVVTEMADLKVLLLDGLVYVTTQSHAEQLREEQKQQQKDHYVLWPLSRYLDPSSANLQLLPPLGGAPPGAVGVGLPGFPGQQGPGLNFDPPPPPVPVDAPPMRTKKVDPA
jgi:hypothetical protein